MKNFFLINKFLVACFSLLNFSHFIKLLVCASTVLDGYKKKIITKGTYSDKKEIEFAKNMYCHFGTLTEQQLINFKTNDFAYISKDEKFVGGAFIGTYEGEFTESSEDVHSKNSVVKNSRTEKEEALSRKKIIKQVYVYSLFIEEEHRRNGLSRDLLDYIHTIYEPDIYSLAVEPKTKEDAINFYNYYGQNFVYIEPSIYYIQVFFHYGIDKFFQSKVDDLSNCKRLENKFNYHAEKFSNEGYKQFFVYMSAIDYKKVKLPKEKVIKKAEELLEKVKDPEAQWEK